MILTSKASVKGVALYQTVKSSKVSHGAARMVFIGRCMPEGVITRCSYLIDAYCLENVVDNDAVKLLKESSL